MIHLGLLLERTDKVVGVNLQLTKACGRMYSRHHSQTVGLAVAAYQLTNVHIADRITVCHHEVLLTDDIFQPEHSPARQRGSSSVNKCHTPITSMFINIIHRPIAQVDCEVVVAGIVLQEIVFDNLTLVA